jgi:hypothetical protein
MPQFTSPPTPLLAFQLAARLPKPHLFLFSRKNRSALVNVHPYPSDRRSDRATHFDHHHRRNSLWGAAELIAEGDYVVGRWEGGGRHTGPAFADFLVGSLPAATGRTMRFTGTTVLRLQEGKIVEEIGLDDGLTALQQLGLVKAA